MPETVLVSNVGKMEKLRPYLEESFKKERYAEITQAIGIHSLLIDPQHTMRDQASLYRIVLRLIKERIGESKEKNYGTWYAQFPTLMDEFVSSEPMALDKASAKVLSSHREAYGAFKSVDDFFFWALDDRKLALDQIVMYIEKTAEMAKG
jgi:hypothetical protein